MHLAVLPLQVLTSGETEKYLGVGIADAVITQLANVRTLSVRPTAAVIKYETGAADPRRRRTGAQRSAGPVGDASEIGRDLPDPQCS